MKEAIHKLGTNSPPAFFAASDSLAIHRRLRALQEAGINLPDRVSLISFNDTSLTKQVYPPLSSITVYTEEMGRAGMDVNKEFSMVLKSLANHAGNQTDFERKYAFITQQILPTQNPNRESQNLH